jgi:hypothetical protein
MATLRCIRADPVINYVRYVTRPRWRRRAIT